MHSYNYGPFGYAFGVSKYDSNRTFMNNPELVVADGFAAFSAALWFYMSPQNPSPSMHEVMTDFYKPNAVDNQKGIHEVGFGLSVNILNSGECGGQQESVKTNERIEFYKEFIDYFKKQDDQSSLSSATETGLSCTGMTAMTTYNDGAGDVKNYFEKRWDSPLNTCKLVPWQTEFPLYAIDSYKRCVCKSWEFGEDACQEGTNTEVTVSDLLKEFEKIQNTPQHSEQESSRTMYQVTEYLEAIRELLQKYHEIILNSDLNELVLEQ